MNATERKIREIAVFLINAQTVNGIAESMNRIAVLIDGYSKEVYSYFSGLYSYIDNTDRAFAPLTDGQRSRVQDIGARLILNPHPWDTVSTFVKLHHMLKWYDEEDTMVALTDKLYSIAEKNGIPTFRED